MLAVLCHFQNILDTFFLGISDETAGIDDNPVRLCLAVRHGKVLLFQKPQHTLGIYQILVTAKGNKQYFHKNSLLCFIHWDNCTIFPGKNQPPKEEKSPYFLQQELFF